MGHQESFVLRKERIRALGLVDPHGAATRKVLLETLADRAEHPDVRSVAARLLAHGKADKAEAVPLLEAASRDVDPLVRLEAARTLWKWSNDPAPAVRVCLQELEGCVRFVRAPLGETWAREFVTARRFLEILSELGSAAHAAVPVLRQLLSTAVPDVEDVADAHAQDTSQVFVRVWAVGTLLDLDPGNVAARDWLRDVRRKIPNEYGGETRNLWEYVWRSIERHRR